MELWVHMAMVGGAAVLGALAGAYGVKLRARWTNVAPRSTPAAGSPGASEIASERAALLPQRDVRKLEAELETIARMTGGLAHEIKNPLSTIGLNTRLLAEMIEDLKTEPEEAARLSRRALALSREVERLEGILTDFLEFAGETRLDLQVADVNELVRDVADFFLPQAEQRGVRLRIQLADEALRARVDASHLKQAILNLLLNAVQAMESQPEEPGRAKAAELILRTTAHSDHLNLHITDTGPGMSAETRSRVFEPYFTTKSGGSGLGLPITRKLIEAMHGQFELHAEEGVGTDVVITLPRSGDLEHDSAEQRG